MGNYNFILILKNTCIVNRCNVYLGINTFYAGT